MRYGLYCEADVLPALMHLRKSGICTAVGCSDDVTSALRNQRKQRELEESRFLGGVQILSSTC
jgi:hypothetical protein